MQFGSAKAVRDLAIFAVLVAVGLVLRERGMHDYIGVLWWALVLAASLYLVWKALTGRFTQGPGGWGAVTPPKLWRWMVGEDDRLAARDDRDQRK